ncbi:hypothetical protein JXB41_01180 [Candidatus Woesearchaeota archaeon]|nr:hypothetical protein [Candidatus Woesearchaeota archaeon]
MLNEKLKDNSKYDLKTIKLKPVTYDKLIKAKAKLEFKQVERHSFDSLVSHLIDLYLGDNELITNDPKRIGERNEKQ